MIHVSTGDAVFQFGEALAICYRIKVEMELSISLSRESEAV